MSRTPRSFPNPKEGLINIRNEYDSCFQHCVAVALHPPENKPTRIDYYTSKKIRENIITKYDWSGVKVPTSIADIGHFKKNDNITINFFNLDTEATQIRPYSISSHDGSKTINLPNFKKHDILISNQDRFINSGVGTSMHN